MGNDYLQAVKNTSCVVIMTECDEFKKYDYQEIQSLMNSDASIYDLRSYLDLTKLKQMGFKTVFRLGAGYM